MPPPKEQNPATDTNRYLFSHPVIDTFNARSACLSSSDIREPRYSTKAKTRCREKVVFTLTSTTNFRNKIAISIRENCDMGQVLPSPVADLVVITASVHHKERYGTAVKSANEWSSYNT